MARNNRTATTRYQRSGTHFLLLFFGLSVLAVMTATAQPPSFPGWSSLPQNGGTLYTPDNAPPGSVWLLLGRPQAAGDQQTALEQLMQADAPLRGSAIATGRPAPAGRALCETVEYSGPQGKYVILYAVMRRNDGRLQTFYPYAHDKPGTTAIYIGGTTYSTE